ncbi:EAL domain-containing protein [Salisediminibacterium beveridgei]|nr:EAL domain-containing protein [Salisediminibacterium beveridgei]
MNRLKYKQKFSIIAVLITFLIGGLLTPITIWLIDQRTVASEAEEGLALVEDLSELIYHLQRERGYVQLYAVDEAGFDLYINEQEQVMELTGKIEREHLPAIQSFGSEDLWVSIREGTRNVTHTENQELSDARGTKEEYNALIQQVLSLTQLTIQESLVAFDRSQDIAIVVDDLINGMLIRAEHIGQIRALGTLFNGQDSISDEDKLDMRVRAEEVSHFQYHMVFENTPEFSNFLDENRTLQGYYTRYEEQREDLSSLINRVIEGEPYASPVDYFEEITPAVDTHFYVLQEGADYLQEEIASRYQTLIISQNLIIGFVTAYLILLLYLFWGFFQSILNSVQTLSDSSRKVAWGDFDVEVNLDTKDEMSEVGEAFNHMIKEVNSTIQANRLSIERTKRHQESILKLSTSGFWGEGYLNDSLDEIAESVTYAVKVDRTSIWLDRQEGLVLSAAYDREDFFPTEGWVAKKWKLKAMYEWSQDGLFFTVSDLDEFRRDHPYIAAYFRHQKVESALLTVIRSKAEVIGIIAFEYRSKGRSWHKDELAYAQSISQLISTVLERHELKQKEQEIRHMAYFDGLTGLPNRQHFQMLLNEQMVFVDEVEMALAVLYIDLDMFKHVNDTWGHSAGDRLLVMVGERLKDGVDSRVVISRFGGDEFTMMSSPIKDREDVSILANRIHSLFQKPFHLEGHDVFISCSIGISIYPNNGSSTEDLIKNADMAMYEAKAQGRNVFAFYTEKLYSNMLNRIEMEAELRKAIEEEQLVLYYQPQFSLNDGKLVGFEALVRWPHDRLGVVSPGEFIPLAEETGLIIALGNQVIRMAAAQQRQWLDEGYRIVPVSVNVSVMQLVHENIIGTLEDALEDFDLKSYYLGIEVTESISAEHLFTIRETLQTIQAKGIVVSIDDFGTGHSSLSYLKNFPVDYLKIDQTFINGIGSGNKDEAIVRSVISMAEGLKMQVIAEGVENRNQENWLRQFPEIQVQGYYYDRPRASEHCVTWIKLAGQQ